MNKFLLRFDEERNDIIWGRDYDQSLTEPGPEIPPDVLLLQSYGALKVTFDNLVGSNKANITGIVRDENPPAEGIATVSISEDDGLAVAWVDNNVIHMYSSRGTIVAPPSLGGLFAEYFSLSDISGLSNWDIGSVTDLSLLFYDTSIINLSPISNWNTSSVTNMSYMFAKGGVNELVDDSLSDLTPLANWNTSSVTNMSYMFANNNELANLAPLANWNTSNVTNMSYMFITTNVSDLTPISNWNTGNVTNMSYMFASSRNITSTTPLANWNTSNVTNMSYMFAYISTNTIDIAGWDLSSVTDMDYCFPSGVTKIICTEEAEAKILSLNPSELPDSVVFERPANIKVLYDAENNINNLESIPKIAAGNPIQYVDSSKYIDLEEDRIADILGMGADIYPDRQIKETDIPIATVETDTGTLYTMRDNLCLDINNIYDLINQSNYTSIVISMPYDWDGYSSTVDATNLFPNLIINQEKIIKRDSCTSNINEVSNSEKEMILTYPCSSLEDLGNYDSPYPYESTTASSEIAPLAWVVNVNLIVVNKIELTKDTSNTSV